MPALTFEWRPAPRLRAVALGVVWRGPRLLMSAVTRDDGRRVGWRPLGGGIEFGETSREAVAREMAEELGARFRPTRLLGVLETIYEHHGAPGHEVVFVWEGVLEEPGLAAAEAFTMVDGPSADHVAWRDPASLAPDEPLPPDGLLPLLRTPLAPGAATA